MINVRNRIEKLTSEKTTEETETSIDIFSSSSMLIQMN
jgi:hypothetical protein